MIIPDSEDGRSACPGINPPIQSARCPAWPRDSERTRGFCCPRSPKWPGLLDSITRLARAYNIIVAPSGRTLSGGLDPTALYMPKRFFGAARNMREGGSLTILATALVDTGSKMDDVVYEEFKGTGNMELILDRKLQERRMFPAIDIVKSGTRREDLLLTARERRAVDIMRRRMNGLKAEDAVETIIDEFTRLPTNEMVVDQILAKWK